MPPALEVGRAILAFMVGQVCLDGALADQLVKVAGMDVRLSASGELELQRGAFRLGPSRVERASGTVAFRCTPRGLEQSWTFARAPEGRKDLVVSVPIRAGAYARDEAAGLLFSARGQRLRFGHA